MMQKVYLKRRERDRYSPRVDNVNEEKNSVKILFRLIVVALVICVTVCIKRIDINLYSEIKGYIDYITDTNFTYSDIITGIKDSVNFIKELIVL